MDGPLGELLAAIEQIPQKADLSKLLQHLQSHEELLIKHLPQLDDLLPVLDPTLNSLGMIFILNCKAAAVPLSSLQAVSVFLRQCRRLLLACDPVQAQMVPGQFVAVCSKFSAAAVAIKTPIAAVRPLQLAALALQPSPRHFTPLHAEFMKVALLAKCYSAAQPLLGQELTQVDKDATGVTPRDLLLYHYYSGTIQVGLKQFPLAIQYFTLAFSAPSSVLNAIMVEAYKKCALCSLVGSGETIRVPKYTSLPMSRHAKNGVAAYTEFAECFGKHDLKEVRASLEKHAAAFSRDHNLGLAKQCVQAVIRRNIHRLTQTYLTLSLGDISESVGLSGAAEAERYVVNMVATGEIAATIDEGKGMVHFTERAERHDSDAAVAAMEGKIQGAVAIAQKLLRLNSQLATDNNYVSRMLRERQPRWEDEAMSTK